MKLLRILLWVLGIFAALVAVALVLAFNPSFQTWAARRALADFPAARISLARVAVGLHRVEATEVRVEQDGAVITLPRVAVDLPLLEAALHQRVAISALVAQGWTVDLTQLAPPPLGQPSAARSGTAPVPSTPGARPPAPGAGASPPPANGGFSGLFDHVSLPVDLSVDGVDVSGRVLLPGAAKNAPAEIGATITGGGLGAGRSGNFQVAVNAHGLPTPGRAGEGSVQGTVGVTMETPRRFSGVILRLKAAGTGGAMASQVALQLQASALKSAAGETYVISVADGRPLVEAQAEYAAASHQLAGTWKVDARRADLAALPLQFPVPEFTAAGSGNFAADPATLDAQVTGNFSATLSQLEKVNPQLAVLGETKLHAAFDLSRRGEAIRVQQFDVDVAGARPIFSTHALQAFEFSQSTGELKVADRASDLLSISIQGVPLAWAAASLPGLALTGDDLRGELVANAVGGGATVRTKSPLTLGHLSLAQGGKPLLENLTVAVTLAGDVTPQGWQAEISSLRVTAGKAEALTFTAKAGRLLGDQQPIKATGHFAASAAPWLTQPVARGTTTLRQGNVEGDFTASWAPDRQEAGARLAVTNLAADPKGAPGALPSLTAEARIDASAQKPVAFSVPLVFDRAGRKSDLTLAGTLDARPKVLVADVRVTSNALVVDDVMPFSALAPGAPAPAAPPAPAGARPAPAPAAPTPAAPGPPDTAPAWAGISGQVAVAMKKITYGTSAEIADLTGVLRVAPTQFTFENLHATLGAGADLKINGGVNFAAGTPQPYVLKAETALTNFDPAPVLRALNPSQPPSVEGKFNFITEVQGMSPTLPALGDRAHGDVNVTSKGGLFRVLAADVSDKIQRTQSAVSAIGGLLGAVTGREKIADYAGRTQIVSDIATSLKEIHYDQLNLHAQRDASLNLTLESLALISPEIRLSGSGKIAHVEAAAIPAQPLDLTVQIAARGRMADLMRQVGMLGPTPDSLGYAPFTIPIHIKGTVEKPDTTELRNALLKAAGGSLLNSLLGN